MLQKKHIGSIIIAIGVLIAVSFIFILASTSEDLDASGNNSVLFYNSIVDLKEVPVGVSRKVVFKYKNISDMPIKIRAVKKSCQCIGNLSSSNTMLPAKATDAIELDYQPGEGEKKYKLLAIFSNGEHYELTVASNGYYDIKLSVDKLEFTNVAQEIGTTKPVMLYGCREICDVDRIKTHIDTPDWLCVKITRDDTMLEVSKPELKNVKRFLEPLANIEVTISPGAPIGYFAETVVFEVDQLNNKRMLTLDCNGEIKREVSYSHSKILFWGESNDWQTILIGSINNPFSVVSVESDSLEYSFQDDGSVSCTKKVKVRPLKKGTLDDLLIINIEHPTHKRLEVPVSRKILSDV